MNNVYRYTSIVCVFFRALVSLSLAKNLPRRGHHLLFPCTRHPDLLPDSTHPPYKYAGLSSLNAPKVHRSSPSTLEPAALSIGRRDVTFPLADISSPAAGTTLDGPRRRSRPLRPCRFRLRSWERAGRWGRRQNL